eukprot:211407-Hanusia_phi.AAC.3
MEYQEQCWAVVHWDARGRSGGEAGQGLSDIIDFQLQACDSRVSELQVKRGICCREEGGSGRLRS